MWDSYLLMVNIKLVMSARKLGEHFLLLLFNF
jgi:hypothetical protein